ncbi:hypothetical protein LUTEI9C_100160 [Luteimonas sp. 9C]|nr:hypothetical protein LUTEI9C_100160 [Luteimonas sp. 9C]
MNEKALPGQCDLRLLLFLSQAKRSTPACPLAAVAATDALWRLCGRFPIHRLNPDSVCLSAVPPTVGEGGAAIGR